MHVHQHVYVHIHTYIMMYLYTYIYIYTYICYAEMFNDHHFLLMILTHTPLTHSIAWLPTYLHYQ